MSCCKSGVGELSHGCVASAMVTTKMASDMPSRVASSEILRFCIAESSCGAIHAAFCVSLFVTR